MSYAEIVAGAKHLPLQEQLMLMEELMQIFRQVLAQKNGKTGENGVPHNVLAEFSGPNALRESESIGSRYSVNKMAGILRPDGHLPSDEELKEMYIDYLTEKYQ